MDWLRQYFRGLPLIALALGAPLTAHANLIAWESYFADEQAIADGATVVAGDGVEVTLTYTIFSDGDGTFTPQSGTGSTYISSEHSLFGNQTGMIELGFDNQNNDPDDYVELVLSFSVPVVGLAFSILDVDSSGGNAWDDGVLLTYNGGTNIRDDASLFSLPTSASPAIALDNEPGYEGFEGFNGRNATAAEDRGNLDVDFGALAITEVTLRYFSTDDARADPAGQRIGVADLTWVVPEPSTALLLAGGLLALGIQRRR